MRFLTSHYDLPLEQDSATKSLPWITAFMVYLASLALTAAFTTAHLIEDWETAMAGTLTMQITPQNGVQGAVTMANMTNTALNIVRSEPGVIAATPLGLDEIKSLLEPWLGQNIRNIDLPLPSMIDIRVENGFSLEKSQLQAKLQAQVPAAQIDDHQQSLGEAVFWAKLVGTISFIVVLIISGAAVIIVLFATRSGFAIHRKVIEVLHLIGAQDEYIAKQFQSHAFKLGLRGSIIGFVMILLTLGLLLLLTGSDQSLFLLTFTDIALLTLIPIFAIALIMLTARITVLKTLSKNM